MGKETKKSKYFASSSNCKTSNSRTKISENNVKNVDRSKKKNCAAGNENDKMKFSKIRIKDYVKSFVKNPVICNNNHALGLSDAFTVSNVRKEVIANQIKRFQVKNLLSVFDRRVTAITWHPEYPQVFIAGSKGGDLLWHNVNSSAHSFYKGIGAGGSILTLKCSHEDPYTVYTASLTGKISRHHFHQNEPKTLFSLSLCVDDWFTSLDISQDRKCMLAGDSKGRAYFLSLSGEPIWKGKKLHASKVNHCQFNVHDPNIFVTASNDHTVKLWDLRTVSSSDAKLTNHLASFPHLKAVNSAYFSPSNGKNILTTDQHSLLRVYSNVLWDKVREIIHPHRQFQHLTQIKAVWHPLEDIIIVGRFPDDRVQANDSRTIDFYDGSNGQLLHRIRSASNTIVTLNSVNSTGEILAAASGSHLMLLKDDQASSDRHLTDCETDEDTESAALSSSNKTNDKKKKCVKTTSKKNVSSKKKKL